MMPVFESRCAQCHGGNAAERRAPDRNALAAMTPERILEALTTGSMVANATGISDGQKRALAELLSGPAARQLRVGPGIGDEESMPGEARVQSRRPARAGPAGATT